MGLSFEDKKSMEEAAESLRFASSESSFLEISQEMRDDVIEINLENMSHGKSADESI
jgi:hypothetical protein